MRRIFALALVLTMAMTATALADAVKIGVFKRKEACLGADELCKKSLRPLRGAAALM